MDIIKKIAAVILAAVVSVKSCILVPQFGQKLPMVLPSASSGSFFPQVVQNMIFSLNDL